MKVTINKIQASSRGISIVYETSITLESPILTQKRTIKFFCDQNARTEFYSAMNGLLNNVVNSLDLDKELWAKGQVSGINVNKEGIAISAVNKVNDICVKVSTPSICTASDEMQAKIEEITQEAIKYIECKRT